jgi:Tol biopolymer transport system component
VVLLAVLGLGWWFGRSSEPSVPAPPQYKLTQLTHDTGYTAQPAISPNGQLLAYVSDRAGEGNLDIWVQQVSGGGEPVRLTSHPWDETGPSFSPDGSQIVFRSRGDIYLIAALGGSERLLAKNGQQPRFSPDGQRVAYHVGGFLGESHLYVAPVAGGAPTKLETNVAWASLPVWSPDGKYILFVGTDDENFAAFETLDWWVAPMDGGEAKRTGASESWSQTDLQPVLPIPTRGVAGTAWVENPDRIVFAGQSGDTTNLYQMSLSPGTWRVEGPPQRLTQGVSESQPSIAADGRIAYASIDINFDIWSIPIDANSGKLIGEPETVEDSAADELQPTVSADGKRLAFSMRRSGNLDVWVRDNVAGRSSALVVTPELEEWRTLLSPDGSTVAFARGPYGNSELFVVPFEGGAEEKLVEGVATIISWSADSKRVLYANRGLATWNTVDVETRDVVRLLDNPGNRIHSPKLSPDGDWLLMKVLEGPEGAGGTFIAPLRNGAAAPRSEWVMVVERRMGTNGFWSPDGNLVYFPAAHEGFPCLHAQRLGPSTKRPEGEAFPVLHMHDERHRSAYRLITFRGDRLYLTVRETTGNIWLAEPQ